MSSDTQPEADPALTKYELYFLQPLYERIYLDKLEKNPFSGRVDGYNHLNECDTTFEISSDTISSYGSLKDYRYVILTCKRFGSSFEYFFYDVKDEKGRFIIKIGQLPSLADISSTESELKYTGRVNSKHLSLFKKGIGLAAHGIGAGSFVYLRKIFEDTIKITYQNNAEVHKISQTDFQKMRMSEKVTTLKDFLPAEMSQFKPLYSILSNGVHDMEEDECKKYFPALKLAIEVIWDNEIERAKKQGRAAQVQAELQKIQKELGG